ncbi:aquaporin rerated protein, other eukaryote [Exophiala aquamarina CBS 119918]|uniref:Aquaporin rerated protein, other eukaryote n=1 Tax=Exophiala aquamarina CBS 119918 TaxID=1182545 RepID=A0A072PEV3_9EURO|nr:aquaporin rerated protein, other eukaryote [Exophiala aquamarina CBS 119918]KEF58257.1 aquaporin rerated protein, other eukaryote [Exophiala aquamarina CBS 119918]
MEKIKAKPAFSPGSSKPKENQNDKIPSPTPVSFLMKIPDGPRNHMIAMLGEFAGTFLFLFFAFSGTQVANTPQTTAGSTSTDLPQGPNPIALLYISLCFGFSLAANAWVFFRVSGGLFNPAVTFGLCLIGALPLTRGALVFISQMLGAIASAGVVKALFNGPLAVTTSLGGGTSLAQGVFIEMFLTAQLVFTIIMLAAEKHKGTFLAPIGIGLSLFIAELSGVYYTGGSLNPARSFGPCVANRHFPSEHWIYWVGPSMGAALASGFFWIIKSCAYQSANFGQDFDDLEASAFNPEESLARPVVMPTSILDRPMSSDRGSRPSRDDPASSLLSQLQSGDRTMLQEDSRISREGRTSSAQRGTQPDTRNANVTEHNARSDLNNAHHKTTVDP